MAKIRGFKPGLWTDEDFVEVSPLARLLWLGMWNFACDNGHLRNRPKTIKMRVLPTDPVDCRELITELADQGLVVVDDDWLTVPNLAKHQKIDRRFWITCERAGCVKPDPPSKPESRRDHASARRDHASAHDDGDGDGDGEVMVKGKTSSRTVVPDPPPRDDVTRICNHLADRIEANTGKRPAIGKTWHDAARLMVDRDNIAEADIHAAIDWATADEFWRANILSLPKLREKYQTLSLQAQRKGNGSGGGKQQRTDDILAAARARMGATR